MSMKIKVVLLDNDKNYLNRLVNAFVDYYADKMEVSAYTTETAALDALKKQKVDVFLIDPDCQCDIRNVPKKCAAAYLVESNEISAYDGKNVIAKYQKINDMYKEILKLYLEITDNTFSVSDAGKAKIIAVNAPAGGNGSTVISIALSGTLAAQGGKVLYLNMENFNSSDMIFQILDTSSFDKILYAVKSHKNNLGLIIEGSVKVSSFGIHYFESYDIMGLSLDELKLFLNTLSTMYDYIVIDMNHGFSEQENYIMCEAYKVLLITDLQENSNVKFGKYQRTIAAHDKKTDKKIGYKVIKIYNKANNAQMKLENSEDEIYIPRLDNTKGNIALIKAICNTGILKAIV